MPILMPSSMRRMACSIFSESPASMVRTMPLSTAVPAMMLRAVPACSSPTLSTAAETGFTSRLTMACTSETRSAPPSLWHGVAVGGHSPRCLRGERQAGRLEERRRVHAGADADGGSGFAALNHRHDTGLADAALEFNTDLRQERGDSLRRLMLLERELRMLVQLAAQRHELLGSSLDDLGDAGINIHAA